MSCDNFRPIFENQFSSGSGSGDKHFTFHQSEPSRTWTIKHFLAKYPAIQTFTTSREIIFGIVSHISTDELIIKFSQPITGFAYLN